MPSHFRSAESITETTDSHCLLPSWKMPAHRETIGPLGNRAATSGSRRAPKGPPKTSTKQLQIRDGFYVRRQDEMLPVWTLQKGVGTGLEPSSLASPTLSLSWEAHSGSSCLGPLCKLLKDLIYTLPSPTHLP